MLTAKHHELLTAYVDGELSLRQRKTVVRLLRRSREARRLLRRLEADARQLRALTVPPLPIDLTGAVLQSIREQVRPTPRLLPLRRRPLHWWTGIAAVASVLALVGLTSFLYFHSPAPSTDPGESLVNQDKPEPPRDAAPPPKDHEPIDRDVVVRDKENDKPLPPVFVGPPEEIATTEPPPRRPDDPIPETAVGAPSREEGRVGVVDLALPALLKVRELEQEPQARELKELLKTGDGFYLELLGRDSGKVLDRLQAALKAAGIELIRDSQVQTRRKQPQLPTIYALFLEDLKREELLKVLQAIGSDDVKVEKRNKAEALFNTPHANLIALGLTEDHRKALVGLVGTELRPLPPPVKGTGPLGVDIRKPVSATTDDRVKEALSKGLPRQGLALVYAPMAPRAGSPEVKQFLDHRKPPQPNTLQLLIVLRPLPR